MPYIYAIFICNNYIDNGEYYNLGNTKYKLILYEKTNNNLEYFLENITYYKNNIKFAKILFSNLFKLLNKLYDLSIDLNKIDIKKDIIYIEKYAKYTWLFFNDDLYKTNSKKNDDFINIINKIIKLIIVDESIEIEFQTYIKYIIENSSIYKGGGVNNLLSLKHSSSFFKKNYKKSSKINLLNNRIILKNEMNSLFPNKLYNNKCLLLDNFNSNKAIVKINENIINFEININKKLMNATINDINIFCKIIESTDPYKEFYFIYNIMLKNNYDFMPYIYTILNCDNYINDEIHYPLHNNYYIILYEKVDGSLTQYLTKRGSTFNTNNIKNLIIDLFNLIYKLYKINIRHGDLNAGNFLYINDNWLIWDFENYQDITENINYLKEDCSKIINDCLIQFYSIDKYKNDNIIKLLNSYKEQINSKSINNYDQIIDIIKNK